MSTIPNKNILSGDIGGTSTRLMFVTFDQNNNLTILHNKHYENVHYTSFTHVIKTFFEETKIDANQIASACFAVAGPVLNGIVNFTNLPWIISTKEIQEHLKNPNVALINDFVGIGYGLETLKYQDIHTLQIGKVKENSLKAYLGAGTGLGVGFMIHKGNDIMVYPTEGGHVDFAPTDDIQLELLKYLRKKYHRVSFERVLSGLGLVNIYHFVRGNKIFGEVENPELRFLIDSKQQIDIAATIAKFAIEKKDILSIRSLEIFINVYGAAAGNLALTTLPYGGLYLVGGIAPRLLPQIQNGKFMERYLDKGRMSDLIKDIPLHIVTNTNIGLQGAAFYAHKLIGN